MCWATMIKRQILWLSAHDYGTVSSSYKAKLVWCTENKQTKHCQSFLTGFISLTPAGRDLLSGLVMHSGLEDEEGERGDLSFLQDLLSPGASSGADDFSKAWQDAFGCFEAPASAPCSTHTAAAGSTNATRSPSQPPSPTGFLPSQLLDHGLSTTG